MTCDVFRMKYIENPQQGFLQEVAQGKIPDIIGGIGHYLSDEDLRGNDSKYALMQKNELNIMIQLLKDGAPHNTIEGISSLEET